MYIDEAKEAGRILAKVAADNWQDHVTPEEKATFDERVGKAQKKTLGGAALGGALGLAGGAVLGSKLPGNRFGVGALDGAALGGVGGALLGGTVGRKVLAKDDLHQARKIMYKGGRARGEARRGRVAARKAAKEEAETYA